MNDESLLETATGLTELGMFAEAEAELLQISPKSPNYIPALRELLSVRLALRDYEGAIGTGTRLLDLKWKGSATVQNLALAFFFAGRLEEARDLLMSIPQLADDGPDGPYTLACIESRLGNFEAALKWLEAALRWPDSYLTKALIDSDLQPLWQSLESCPVSLVQAHLLIGPAFDDVRQQIGVGEIDPELDGNDLKHLPKAWQRLFRFNHETGTHQIHPLTASKHPMLRAKCLRRYQTRQESSLQRIERAQQHATRVVVANQAAYAVQHLAAGNFHAARNHVGWALRQDPTLLPSFRKNVELRPLTYLFEELAASFATNHEWTRVLLGACLPASGIRFPELVEEIPAELHDTFLYLVRAGQALHNCADYAGAIAIWLKVCDRWPHDSLGFGNGVTCLMELGLWERAQTLLSRAREGFRHFYLCSAQRTRIEARDVAAAATPPTEPFCGQPDLGGLLGTGIPNLDALAAPAGPPEARRISRHEPGAPQPSTRDILGTDRDGPTL